jgi:hypothetical protein
VPFGILALHTDSISPDALIAARNAWVLDRAKLLADIPGLSSFFHL